MGGGASSSAPIAIVSTGSLLGRAFSALSFPGHHRLQDFHSPRARPLTVLRAPPLFEAMFGDGTNGGVMGDVFKDFFDRMERGRDSDAAPGIGSAAPSTLALRSEEEEKDVAAAAALEQSRLGAPGNLGVSGPTLPEDDEGGVFALVVGADRIVLEDVEQSNEDGWTPLHACCYSFSTVAAACLLIDEISRIGGDLNRKTKSGPGAYNSGWTALQMACAYGLDVVVSKLLSTMNKQDVASSFPPLDVNCVTSLSVTPLLESCYRGHLTIVKSLLATPVDVEYLPPIPSRNASPFSRPPSQRPLGESSRGGFYQLVSALLDAGASVNAANHSGWTALHEACRCGHRDIVKLLLEAGADATLRTKPENDAVGLLPWQVCCLRSIRELLEEKFGTKCRPNDAEERERLERMGAFAFGAFGGGGAFVFRFGQYDDDDNDNDDELGLGGGDTEEENENDSNLEGGIVRWGGVGGTAIVATGGALAEVKLTAASPITVPGEAQSESKDWAEVADAKVDVSDHAGLRTADAKAPSSSSFPVTSVSSSTPSSLSGTSPKRSSHLGDLPSLGPSPTRAAVKQTNYKESTKASRAKKKPIAPFTEEEERLAPPQFRCEISRRLLSKPVRTQHGHVFEEAVIKSWFEKQGSVCPISGEPLSERDLERAEDVRRAISKWREDLRGKSGGGEAKTERVVGTSAAGDEEDVYRF